MCRPRAARRRQIYTRLGWITIRTYSSFEGRTSPRIAKPRSTSVSRVGTSPGMDPRSNTYGITALQCLLSEGRLQPISLCAAGPRLRSDKGPLHLYESVQETGCSNTHGTTTMRAQNFATFATLASASHSNHSALPSTTNQTGPRSG